MRFSVLVEFFFYNSSSHYISVKNDHISSRLYFFVDSFFILIYILCFCYSLPYTPVAAIQLILFAPLLDQSETDLF